MACKLEDVTGVNWDEIKNFCEPTVPLMIEKLKQTHLLDYFFKCQQPSIDGKCQFGANNTEEMIRHFKQAHGFRMSPFNAIELVPFHIIVAHELDPIVENRMRGN